MSQNSIVTHKWYSISSKSALKVAQDVQQWCQYIDEWFAPFLRHYHLLMHWELCDSK